MKKNSYLLVMIILSVVMTSIGCKKKNDDNSTSKEQYAGTWQGTITFTGGQTWTELATLTIRLSGENLLGYFSVQGDPEITRLRLITFANGVYSFSLVCSTPDDEDCQNWNVTGTLILVTTNNISINMSGTFCGSQGGEQGTLTGDLAKISSTPEDANYITFGQVGREWRYRVTGFDGTQCLLEYYLSGDLGNGVFSGIATSDCGWQWDQIQYWWYVSPNMWCDMSSASLDTRILNILADTKVGDIYQTILGEDTVTVTVLSLNDPVIIDGKTYNCIKVRKEGFQFDHYFEGYAWMTFGIGLIKYEAIEPNQPYDVHLEELIWKNF
ncbi:MAG: hypothetical protein HQ542_13080 [Bacteroidia bacterium]|nr:hypothetical protein [Bacteroidia bacterium]